MTSYSNDTPNLVSDCHHAAMVVKGNSFGEGSTNHYECTECGKACNWVQDDTELREAIKAANHGGIDANGATDTDRLEALFTTAQIQLVSELLERFGLYYLQHDGEGEPQMYAGLEALLERKKQELERLK